MQPEGSTDRLSVLDLPGSFSPLGIGDPSPGISQPFSAALWKCACRGAHIHGIRFASVVQALSISNYKVGSFVQARIAKLRIIANIHHKRSHAHHVHHDDRMRIAAKARK